MITADNQSHWWVFPSLGRSSRLKQQERWSTLRKQELESSEALTSEVLEATLQPVTVRADGRRVTWLNSEKGTHTLVGRREIFHAYLKCG